MYPSVQVDALHRERGSAAHEKTARVKWQGGKMSTVTPVRVTKVRAKKQQSVKTAERQKEHGAKAAER